MAKNLLDIKGLSVTYNSIVALEDVDLSVGNGSCVAVVGANGAGKSSLLKAIMGFVKPSKGTIAFNGKPINDMAPHKRAALGISFVPEGARVFSRMSVEENLLVGAYAVRQRNRIEERLEYVFELFPRLKERLKQRAGTLSGGERQMLALARALMGSPRLLMVDEISLGLMPKLVDLVFDIVDRLSSEGLTILLAEQNAVKALQVADEIYIFQLGRVLRRSDPESLQNDPYIRKAYLGR